MDHFLLLSSMNPGLRRSQSSSPGTAGLVKVGWGVFWSSKESRQPLKLLFLLQCVLQCRMLSHLRTLSKSITLGTGQVMRDPEQILGTNYEWLNWRHPEVPSSQRACESLKLNYPVWRSH